MPKIPDSVPWKNTGRDLGGGGQCQVVQVEAKGGAALVPGAFAMKILRNVDSAQAKQRFLREISQIKAMSDARIVRIVDHHAEDSNFLFYVMPYDPSYVALDKLAFSGDSPFLHNARASLELIAECAEAIGTVHQKGVVHRDLKPANILVNTRNRLPLLIDFGCCYVDHDLSLTLSDEGVGTKDYMAPECEPGETGDPSPRADIYSLGKILHAIVTGQRAFARERPAFTTRNLSKVLPDFPDCWHLTQVFKKSIRRRPEDRYQTALDMACHCRTLARAVVGRFPPLEVVEKLCPACGQGVLDARQQDVPMHCVFGNPMPQGVYGLRCPECGFLVAWDIRVRAQRETALQTME